MKLYYLLVGLFSTSFSIVFAQSTHPTSTSLSSIEALFDPSTQEVQLRLQGTHPTTACHFNTINYYVSQPEVYIQLSSFGYDMAGQAVTPFDTTISIGMLLPGTYHINIQGQYFNSTIQDTNQYYFTISMSGTTSVDKENDFELFPVPAYDVIHLGQVAKDAAYAQLYTVDGNLMKTFKLESNSVFSSKLDISEFKSGTYFLQLKSFTGDPLGIKRLIKN